MAWSPFTLCGSTWKHLAGLFSSLSLLEGPELEGVDRERDLSGKEAGKLNAKRRRVCRFPGLMCTLGLRGEEAGRDLQLKQMSLGNLLSKTCSGLFLWAVLTSCFEGELGT